MLYFEKDSKTKEYKANKQLSVLSKASMNQLPDEYNKFSQKDKDDFMKNQMLQETMEKLIGMFRKRDTKGNIQKL